MSGWIKIHRNILNHWLYTEDRVFSKFEAWNDILLMANYMDKQTMIKGKLYTVKRGESLLSFDSWAKRWNWEKTKVRRFMKLLQDDSMIVIKSDNKTTHLTICNYERYQDERHADATPTPHKRHSNATPTPPTKEREEGKESKELKNSVGGFVKPTLADLEFILSRKEALKFLDHYDATGWMMGRVKIKDWEAAARKWKSNQYNNDQLNRAPRPKMATKDDDE